MYLRLIICLPSNRVAYDQFDRHLHYTSHIGDFVIISEEAIAKGIRRIVAITGMPAYKAMNETRTFYEQVNALNKAIAADETGEKTKEFLKQIGEISDDLSRVVMSAWEKVIVINRIIRRCYVQRIVDLNNPFFRPQNAFRNQLNTFKKTLDAKERKLKADVVDRAVQNVTLIMESRPKCRVLVELFRADSNTKALDAALKKVRAAAPDTSALFLSIDRTAKKIFALSSVPKVSPTLLH